MRKWNRFYNTSIRILNEMGVLRFFGVASIEAWRNVYERELEELADFRKSDNHTLTIASLAEHLCRSWVAIVFTPCFSKVPVCGATRWIGNTPLIQMTDRDKTVDQFWFTFYREAAHVLLHGKKEMFIEPESILPNEPD